MRLMFGPIVNKLFDIVIEEEFNPDIIHLALAEAYTDGVLIGMGCTMIPLAAFVATYGFIAKKNKKKQNTIASNEEPR